MPEYKYTALTSRGEQVKGTVEAADKTDAIHTLREKGLFPTKVRSFSGSETSESSSYHYDELIKRSLEAESKSRNPFTMLKNAIRRKILFGSFKKDKGMRDMR